MGAIMQVWSLELQWTDKLVIHMLRSLSFHTAYHSPLSNILFMY
jgi:hypothetical protein